MVRRLALFVFVALALFGMRHVAATAMVLGEALAATDDCCPCPDDEDDGCCDAAACACAVAPAILVPERTGVPERTVLAEVEVRSTPLARGPHERSAAPPHPPPIG